VPSPLPEAGPRDSLTNSSVTVFSREEGGKEKEKRKKKKKKKKTERLLKRLKVSRIYEKKREPRRNMVRVLYLEKEGKSILCPYKRHSRSVEKQNGRHWASFPHFYRKKAVMPETKRRGGASCPGKRWPPGHGLVYQSRASGRKKEKDAVSISRRGKGRSEDDYPVERGHPERSGGKGQTKGKTSRRKERGLKRPPWDKLLIDDFAGFR